MQVKVIADGSSKFERFVRRWGLSLLVDEDVLFDTFGDPNVFIKNIRKFNIEVDKIRHLILSHDDWDHVAGLWRLLSYRNDFLVYVCSGFKQEIKDKIASFHVRCIEVSGWLQIKENVYTTGELSVVSRGRKIYEQSLVVRGDEGLMVICGCAHPGVDAIVKRSKEILGEDICYLLGGFHLKDNAQKTNMHMINELQKAGIRKIVPLHCTGSSACRLLRKMYGTECLKLSEGQSQNI